MKAKYHYDNNFTLKPKEYGDLLLYQLGEMMSEAGNVIDPHAHLDWYEFTYVFSGQGVITTNNVSLPVSQDCIYVSMPQEIHKIESDDLNPLRYCFCSFNFKEGSPLHELINKDKGLFLEKANRCFSAPHYAKYFQHILSYPKSNDHISNLLLEHELKTLILRVIRHISSGGNKNYRMPKINNVELLCFNIINYIDNNLTSIDNISCLAEEFSYNYSYISRCFKNCIGQNICNYFMDKKLELAKQLLEENELSITEIADNLNYSSIYVFSRAFKDRFGMSPKMYRNTSQKKYFPLPPQQ